MPGAFVSAVGPHLTIVVPQQHRTFVPVPGLLGPQRWDSRDHGRGTVRGRWFRQCPRSQPVDGNRVRLYTRRVHEWSDR